MGKEKVQKDLSANKDELIIKEFMLLNAVAQNEKIKEILNKMYEGTVEVTNNHVEKVLNIAFDPKDTEIYLTDNLCVAKKDEKILFSFKKKKKGLLFLLFFLGFLFIGGFATYTGVQLYQRSQLNIDLDGDGIADLNIDIDDDYICDINCDTNRDRMPDINIDYHNNRKPIFNVQMEDGTIKNRINIDIDGDGKCDINCDTNHDGWPDLNIDYNGDGIVNFDRDTNGDDTKDLDLDNNGDGVCDLNCDDNGDNICDRLCTDSNIGGNGSGTTNQKGNNDIDTTAASLVVVYERTESILIDMLYPDDTPEEEGVVTKVPDMKWTVTNTTNRTLYYNIEWRDLMNTYETDNFWFKVSSTNNGFNQNWMSVPKETGFMVEKIAILPGQTQEYTASFTLHGTGESQDEDQGKTFKAKVHVEMIYDNQ